MRSRLWLCTGVLLLLLVGIASASGLSLSWSRPTVLAPDAGRAVRAVGVQVGSAQTVAAWASGRGVFAAIAGANGRFGVPQRLSDVGVGNDGADVLATDARGDSLVLWQRPYRDDPSHGLNGSLFAAYRPAGGRFGAARRIARNAVVAAAALDGQGNAVIAWDQPSGRGRSATVDTVDRQADGSYGPVSVLARGEVNLRGLAVNPAGQAVVVWQAGPLPFPAIQAATREPGDRFSSPVTVVPATVGGRAGGVDMDDAGQALIAWMGPYDASPSGLPYRYVQVTPLMSGASAPGPAQTLLAPGLGRVDSPPQINVDGAGDAVVAWQNTSRDGRAEELLVAREVHGSRFTSPITIGTSYFGGTFDSAIGPGGQAIVAWDRLGEPVQAVMAASPARAFGRAAKLTDDRDSAFPTVAIGPGGRAVGIWWDLSTPSSLRYARTTDR